MNKFPHTYMCIKGVDYYDYTLYSDQSIYWTSGGKSGVCIFADGIVGKKLKDTTPLCDMRISPKKGSSLYMVNKCPYAIDDIRRNYTIKRTFDSADYNVLSDIYSKYYYRGSIEMKCCVIFPTKKVIVISENDKISAAELITKAISVEPITENDILNSKYVVNTAFICKYYVEEIIIDILKGKNTKPVVYYKNLDINGSNNMTVDVLNLVYGAMKQSWEQKNADNLVVQLNMMNNHNWRDYPGTMSMLFNEMYNRCPAYRLIKEHSSRYPKVIKAFCNIPYTTFASEEDLNLGRRFIDSILNIGECRFTNFNTLFDKLRKASITQTTFSCLYNNIIKITPKTYEAYQKEKDKID